LHSSKTGKIRGRFHGEDIFTTKESEKLLRLPLYYDLENVNQIGEFVNQFFQSVWK